MKTFRGLKLPAPEFPKTGINKYVSSYLESRKDLSGKKVLDCPAGDGRSSFILKNNGAQVVSADLFPEFFKLSGACDEVDISKGLPYGDGEFDFVICQEGIEHFPDQLAVLKEFARVLRPGGELLLTTPNISHLRAKLSYFFNETDYYKRTPPSEMDGVWFSHRQGSELYFGHLFLLNNQKLRTLAILSGFKVTRFYRTQLGTTSLLLFPLFWPLIFVFNLFPFIFYKNKLSHIPARQRYPIMREIFWLNVSFRSLVCKHSMVSLKKIRNEDEVLSYLKELTRT